jgi:hypothetical protein
MNLLYFRVLRFWLLIFSGFGKKLEAKGRAAKPNRYLVRPSDRKRVSI